MVKDVTTYAGLTCNNMQIFKSWDYPKVAMFVYCSPQTHLLVIYLASQYKNLFPISQEHLEPQDSVKSGVIA